MSFEKLKVGDKVTRLLGGKIRMPMQVVAVKDDVVVCAAIHEGGTLFNGGWQFDRKTGAEEDEDLGWGVKFGATGSYLVLEH